MFAVENKMFELEDVNLEESLFNGDFNDINRLKFDARKATARANFILYTISSPIDNDVTQYFDSNSPSWRFHVEPRLILLKMTRPKRADPRNV